MSLSKNDFVELSQKYYSEIYGFIYKRTKNKDTSMDLTQDTFLLAQRGGKSLREKKNVRAWLYKIARHRVYNYINRERASWELKNINDEIELSSGSDPFLQLLNKQQVEQVGELFDALPSRQRQCLELIYQEYSYIEISNILGIHLNTVKSNIFKARISAQKWLKENNEELPDEERP